MKQEIKKWYPVSYWENLPSMAVNFPWGEDSEEGAIAKGQDSAKFGDQVFTGKVVPILGSGVDSEEIKAAHKEAQRIVGVA